MTDRIQCSQYDSSANRCKSGFPAIHATCWGGNSACPTCNAQGSQPMCMKTDLPAHLMRADGHPLNWPDNTGASHDE